MGDQTATSASASVKHPLPSASSSSPLVFTTLTESVDQTPFGLPRAQTLPTISFSSIFVGQSTAFSCVCIYLRPALRTRTIYNPADTRRPAFHSSHFENTIDTRPHASTPTVHCQHNQRSSIESSSKFQTSASQLFCGSASLLRRRRQLVLSHALLFLGRLIKEPSHLVDTS